MLNSVRRRLLVLTLLLHHSSGCHLPDFECAKSVYFHEMYTTTTINLYMDTVASFWNLFKLLYSSKISLYLLCQTIPGHNLINTDKIGAGFSAETVIFLIKSNSYRFFFCLPFSSTASAASSSTAAAANSFL